MPVCAKCGNERALNTRCKPCRNAYLRTRYAENPSLQREASLRCIARDPERDRRWRNAWEWSHPDKVAARAARRYARGDWTKWARANPEHWRAYNQARDKRYREHFAGHHTGEDEVVLRLIQGNRCAHCEASNPDTVDHIYPRSFGGPNTADNLQLLCQSCNSRKHNAIQPSGDVELIIDMRLTSFYESFAAYERVA